MKWLALILTGQLLSGAALPFTLENLGPLRLYFINHSDFITPGQETALKTQIKARLTAEGFALDQRDPSTFFVKIESLHGAKIAYVMVQIGIGEEIITRRRDAVESFAFTYHAGDFIETETPLADTNESINFLMDEFFELYHEDNE